MLLAWSNNPSPARWVLWLEFDRKKFMETFLSILWWGPIKNRKASFTGVWMWLEAWHVPAGNFTAGVDAAGFCSQGEQLIVADNAPWSVNFIIESTAVQGDPNPMTKTCCSFTD